MRRAMAATNADTSSFGTKIPSISLRIISVATKGQSVEMTGSQRPWLRKGHWENPQSGRHNKNIRLLPEIHGIFTCPGK